MALPSRDVLIQTQDIQFRQPVYLGDEIILKATHEDVSKAVVIINFKLKFYRSAEKKPELVAKANHPLKKLLVPEEVAQAIKFFVDAPQQVNGVKLPINAAMYINNKSYSITH